MEVTDEDVCVQKPVGNFIRAVLLMPLYVPLFAPKAHASPTAATIYINVLKVRARTTCCCLHAPGLPSA